MFRYEICDRLSLTVLKTHSGYSTEDDARLQAKMEATVENIKNYNIKVEEEPENADEVCDANNVSAETAE